MTWPQHDEPNLSPVTIERVEAHVLRCPIAMPVQTSFGIMRDRPALFIEIIARDGTSGWGEVWCNFPSCGAEHRAALIRTVLAPLLEGQQLSHPAAVFEQLTQRTAILALQSGEHGPIAQAIAGVDLALWDMQARRAGLPLWRLLGGRNEEIGVYASGLNPGGAEPIVAERLARGFNAFKLKLGFGRERDAANLAALREMIGPQAQLMADANQAWDLDTALSMGEVLDAHNLVWLEEPLRCNRPAVEWRTLADHLVTPLAAGENFADAAAFEAGIANGALRVIQPDAAKWGGISGTLPIAQAVRTAGLTYCPHYLGAGVGLLASAHLLAAAGDSGGSGMLEVDANPNPLRSLLAGPIEQPLNGRVRLGHAPGIGVVPDISALRREIAPSL
ncbi:mandelate racemase/muconate lactonizing enzyme family protein [Paraburkholderia unamae]|uniref:L-alanine-DL-glutamate epimerase-like enolase superfamily enzyme n=1 Tax=Paraburkholderia unamae TaxID=219649 RepID=A0ABX5KR59_9BURK|nr:mandelate racemase/muconate lactonizing enzyme family protein [Paraburkholderia unamae]PVX83979.1 L-alanine-DL-glutamate epimerase-like enolase superfamily enzyme [Paraburkholderia unamae]CAG9265030.1 Mandelate racemase/muconate lactonizing protein [Paraburkholderia unamae]